jgi:hypothetical protein
MNMDILHEYLQGYTWIRKGILGYLDWTSFLGYDLPSYPHSQKISCHILAYPVISLHILSYPKISSGANSQVCDGCPELIQQMIEQLLTKDHVQHRLPGFIRDFNTTFVCVHYRSAQLRLHIPDGEGRLFEVIRNDGINHAPWQRIDVLESFTERVRILSHKM